MLILHYICHLRDLLLPFYSLISNSGKKPLMLSLLGHEGPGKNHSDSDVANQHNLFNWASDYTLWAENQTAQHQHLGLQARKTQYLRNTLGIPPICLA